MSRSDKIAGFHAAAEAAGLEDSARVLDGGPLDEYGDSVMRRGRPRRPRCSRAGCAAPPTGIVAVNDLMALRPDGGLARRRPGACPDDVSVVGIDGVFLSALCATRC